MPRKVAKQPTRKRRKIDGHVPRTPPEGMVRHFLFEWRNFRDMTQEALGSEVGKSASALSQIETYGHGMEMATLLSLSNALKCTPGELLEVNPLADNTLWSIWAKLDDRQRKLLLDLARNIAPARSAAE